MDSSNSAPIQANDFRWRDDGKLTETLIPSVIQKLDRHEDSKTVKEVSNELKIILDFLRDKKLVEESKLRYLIDDLVEMVVPLDKRQNSSDLFSKSDSIKSWLGEIRKRILKFGVDGAEMRPESVGEGGDDEDEDVLAIGLRDDVERLLSTAIFNSARPDENNCVWTSLITGVAGIGKTALARQVYNHARVLEQFEPRAWVCVSSDLTNKEVLMELIQQVVDSDELERDSLLEKMKRTDNGNLQQMLQERLKGKRYFIVLDDMPREMTLKSILEGLPHEDMGSRLLLTSRTRKTDRNLYIHEMQPLDFDQSWRLFSKTIFSSSNKSSNEHKFPKNLEKNGRDMLTKCEGVPSAIKEVARQLAEKRRSGSEWEQLLPPIDFNAILKALILPVIQYLESRQEWKELEGVESRQEQKELKGVTGELRKMLHSVRDKKVEEGSSLYYLICDVLDMARDLVKKNSISIIDLDPVLSSISKVKTYLLEFGERDGGEDVVGLEEDIQLLLRGVILTGEQYSSWESTCLITGMIGIGKTTLARQIYNHTDVKNRFDRRAWVCASTDFSYKKMLINILQQMVHCTESERDSLLMEAMERPDNFCLKQMLHKHLQGVPYLIVFDDIPKDMCLDYFREALPSKDKGSRLLFTSRCTANKLLNIRYTYRMETLDPRKSWQLLLKTIPSELNFPKDLENKGREVLRKCDGMPLAIKEVGKQLTKRMQSGSSKWKEVLESVDLGEILEILEPIYHKLDPQSRSCFMHLAFFKEHTSIRIEKLKQVLDIVGMISEYHDGMLTEESIVEIKDTKSFRVNAMLHTLSIKKAEQVMKFDILRNNDNDRPSHSACHRVISCSRDKFSYSTNQTKHLVSLFFHGGGYYEASPSYWKSFELLKILDWEDFGLKIFPESIGTLLELRYLGLRNNYIQELPQSLGGLQKLEVLDIALNFLVELPNIICEMGGLRHLYMSDVICREPLKIDMLEDLETITYISLDDWTYELLGMETMSSLYKLGIEKIDENSDLSKHLKSLARLRNLEHLILRGFCFRSMPCLDDLGILQHLIQLKLDGFLPKLPNSFPPFIEYLTLVNSCLDEDPMRVLEKQNRLKCLKLRNAYTGPKMEILSEGFPNLEVLCIEELWDLRNVKVSISAMSRLLKFEIKSCPYLETLPEDIGSTRVVELKMVTTKSIATKIRNSALNSNVRWDVDINP